MVGARRFRSCEKMRKKTKDPATCIIKSTGGESSFDPVKGSRVPRRSLFVPVNFELWPKVLISIWLVTVCAALLCLCIFLFFGLLFELFCLVYFIACFIVFEGCSPKCSPRWCRHSRFWRLAVFPLAKLVNLLICPLPPQRVCLPCFALSLSIGLVYLEFGIISSGELSFTGGTRVLLRHSP